MDLMFSTNNSDWGFWGTWARERANDLENVFDDESPILFDELTVHPIHTHDAWAHAVNALRELVNEDDGVDDVAIRDALDSRIGRHFAEALASRVLRGEDFLDALFPVVSDFLPHLLNGDWVDHS